MKKLFHTNSCYSFEYFNNQTVDEKSSTKYQSIENIISIEILNVRWKKNELTKIDITRISLFK